MSGVGFFDEVDVLQIPSGLGLYKGVRAVVGGGVLFLSTALLQAAAGDAAFFGEVHLGGYYVPRVADEEEHPALGEGSHQEWCALGAVRLLDDQVLVIRHDRREA